MSELDHIKMLHSHVDRQMDAQKRLTDTFAANQKNLLEANLKVQQEVERARAEIEELKIQLGLVMKDSSELRQRLNKPMSQAVAKLFRRGPYKKQKLLK